MICYRRVLTDLTEIVKIIGGGLVIACISGIAGAVLFAILVSYLKK